MRTLLIKLLSILVHHANRNTKAPEFYAIKKRLLLKYGEFICNEVQIIEGKECYSCNGSGWYSYNSTCYKCAGTGMYRDQCFNLLAKYKFGNYYFHQPIQRMRRNDGGLPIVQGYITHSFSEYGNISKNILYLMFDTKYFFSTFNIRRKLNFIQTIKYKWHFYRLSKQPEITDELPF